MNVMIHRIIHLHANEDVLHHKGERKKTSLGCCWRLTKLTQLFPAELGKAASAKDNKLLSHDDLNVCECVYVCVGERERERESERERERELLSVKLR